MTREELQPHAYSTRSVSSRYHYLSLFIIILSLLCLLPLTVSLPSPSPVPLPLPEEAEGNTQGRYIPPVTFHFDPPLHDGKSRAIVALEGGSGYGDVPAGFYNFPSAAGASPEFDSFGRTSEIAHVYSGEEISTHFNAHTFESAYFTGGPGGLWPWSSKTKCFFTRAVEGEDGGRQQVEDGPEWMTVMRTEVFGRYERKVVADVTGVGCFHGDRDSFFMWSWKGIVRKG